MPPPWWPGGGELVADDVTVIELRPGCVPVVLPGPPRQKLWRDTLDALAIAPGRRLRSTVDLEKFECPLSGHYRSTPVPLASIRHLTQGALGEVLSETGLKGRQAFMAVDQQIYRRHAVTLIGNDREIFAKTAGLVGSVPQYRMRMPHGLTDLIQRLADWSDRWREEEP
ncbi:hypothetical protein CCP1ISM_10052 [Azospirillaceae bacterium]|nr:hypothetical protein MTCCP1_00053 [uncultured bacterium]